jgi:hypothetical protein
MVSLVKILVPELESCLSANWDGLVSNGDGLVGSGWCLCGDESEEDCDCD